MVKIQKCTKKVGFAALLKPFFDFVPRGTNVNNFFVRKTCDYKAKTKKVHKKFTFFSGGVLRFCLHFF